MSSQRASPEPGASASGPVARSEGTLPVSVIIPAYNREHCIARAVRSALQQAPTPPAEVIVVDDASTDETALRAIEAGARIIRNGENLGEAGARTTGVEAASQGIVAFLDSDDYWLPDHLEVVFAHRHLGDLIATSAVTDGSDAGRLLGHASTSPVVVGSPANLFFPANPLPLSAVVARRAAVLRHGGFRTMPGGADLDLWIRMFATERIVVLPSATVVYTVHDDQVSQDKEMMWQSHLNILSRYRGEPWCTNRLFSRVNAATDYDRARACLRQHHVRAASKIVARTVGHPIRMSGVCGLLVWRWRLRRRATAAVTSTLRPAI